MAKDITVSPNETLTKAWRKYVKVLLNGESGF